MRFGRVAKAGAKLLLEKDGAKAEERDFPASNSDADTNAEFTLRLTPGAHTLRLTNTGADWITLREIHVTPLGPTLRAFGKASQNAVAGFVYRSSATPDSQSGTLLLPSLAPGRYRLLWRDAATGATLSETGITATTAPLRLTTPPVAEAVAFYVRRQVAGRSAGF